MFDRSGFAAALMVALVLAGCPDDSEDSGSPDASVSAGTDGGEAGSGQAGSGEAGSGQAGSGGSEPTDEWYCQGVSASTICLCQPVGDSGAEATDSCSAASKEGCCFTLRAPGGSGDIMGCQCYPEDSPNCGAVNQAGFEAVSTCPPN